MDVSNKKSAEEEKEEEEEEKPTAIEADDSQPECDVCREEFQKFFDTEKDEWMYLNAVRSSETNKLVHKACHSLHSPPQSFETVLSPPPPSSSSSSSSLLAGQSGSDLGKRLRPDFGAGGDNISPPSKIPNIFGRQ